MTAPEGAGMARHYYRVDTGARYLRIGRCRRALNGRAQCRVYIQVNELMTLHTDGCRHPSVGGPLLA